MKVIFLDIDWVLIRFWDTPQIRKTRADKKQWWLIRELDEDLVKNLINIIQQTNAYIVISSSWRHWLMDVLRDEFYKNWDRLWFDLWNRVISKTPSWLDYWRWNEILTWLNDYHKTCKTWEHITNWVVIDDDSFDMKRINRLWLLVKTETHEWLTKEKAQEVILILNKQ